MIFREAKPEDIPQIQVVRNSVTQNKLSSPDLVTDQDCLEYISDRGKGWVCEIEGKVVAFAIADLEEENIWALFVTPECENLKIGTRLQHLMLTWYFEQGKSLVWLGTAPGTRADIFYRKSGWKENGTNGLKEIRFEMTKSEFDDYNLEFCRKMPCR